MEAIPSTLHQKVKFPTEDGVVVVRADQKVARQCLVATINHEIKQKEQVEAKKLWQLQCPEGLTGANSAEELVQIHILPYIVRYF